MGDELRPRIRYINAGFYYATIFNRSLNDAPDSFCNIAFVAHAFLFLLPLLDDLSLFSTLAVA